MVLVIPLGHRGAIAAPLAVLDPVQRVGRQAHEELLGCVNVLYHPGQVNGPKCLKIRASRQVGHLVYRKSVLHRRVGRPPRAGWKFFTGARPRPERSDFFSDGSPAVIGGGPGALVSMPRAGGRGADRRLDPPAGGRPGRRSGRGRNAGRSPVCGGVEVFKGRLRSPEKWTSFVVGHWFQCPGPRVRAGDRGGDPPADGGGAGGPGCVGVPVAEVGERLAITQAPKASAAEERPVRRRES